MGIPCFLHNPLPLSPTPSSSSPSSSPCFFSSLFSYLPINGGLRKKNSTAIACMSRENQNDGLACERRCVLFLGISVLPLLATKVLKVSATEGPETNVAEQTWETEQILLGDIASNPFLTFLKGIGIYNAAVLCLLYSFIWKEKLAAEALLQSMTNKLNEKERIIASLEDNFESRLLHEKAEQSKQLTNDYEGKRQFLISQLNMADTEIAGLRQALQSKQILVKDLNFQMETLQNYLTVVNEGKKELEEKLEGKLDLIKVLQERILILEERTTVLGSEIKIDNGSLCDLNFTLAAKETELKKLNSAFEIELNRLKLELMANQKELELKNTLLEELDANVKSLIAQLDGCTKEFDSLKKECEDLKSSSTEKAIMDADLLSERDEELHWLKEKLDLALKEVSRNQVLVADLSQERDDITKMLAMGQDNVKSLEHELKMTQDNYANSKNEVTNLAEEVQASRIMCSDLEAKVLESQSESAEVRELFQARLEEENHGMEALAGDLALVKEVLKNTKEQLKIKSNELAATVKNCENLKKELADVYRRVEIAVQDLEEEKKISSLNKELQTLEKEILTDIGLRVEIEEAKRSLDETNRNAMLLTRELEVQIARLSDLEVERDMLYESIAEEKRVSKEARESLEEAQNNVMRLERERESLENTVKKLEEELVSAKGEILQLRGEINSSNALLD